MSIIRNCILAIDGPDTLYQLPKASIVALRGKLAGE